MKLAEPKTTKRILRAGIVGCGRIASTFDRDPRRKYVATHAGAYTASRSTRLVAACDLDESRLKDFGAQWHVKRLYQNFDEMLAQENLDIVSICTWPGSHYDLAKKAVAVGVRGIFCEKPITDQLDQADEIVELCQREGVLLAVNHSRRWDTGHQKVKKILDSGKLGKIYQVQCYYTAGISNTGTHLFDLLRYFLGEAKTVSASPAPILGDKDPTLSGQILFEKDVLVSIVGLNVSDYLIFDIDFFGSKGRLRLTHSGFALDYWKIGPSAFFSGYKELVPAKLNLDLKKKQMMQNAVADIAQCLAKKRPPLCTGDDGRKALEMICAFQESLRLNQKISLPLENRKVKLG